MLLKPYWIDLSETLGYVGYLALELHLVNPRSKVQIFKYIYLDIFHFHETSLK